MNVSFSGAEVELIMGGGDLVLVLIFIFIHQTLLYTLLSNPTLQNNKQRVKGSFRANVNNSIYR